MMARARRIAARPLVLWGLAAFIQIGLILTTLGERLIVHATGSEVTLALRPVDPRDLLRGDYVILNPQIGRVALDLARDTGEFRAGDEVWTVVEADDDGVSRAVEILRSPPQDGRRVFAGHVRSVWQDVVNIDYGLTAFYVPEGRGREIERLPGDTLRLVVALTADGKSAPLRLVADGKTLLSESAF
uniref:GDYXXLXY domain-containing protein n=1 Tax=Stappia sp. TaxID=1870903 RepID=UPI003BAA06A3